MKEINLPSGNYLFIEIPDDATDFYIDIHNNKKTNDTVLWYSMPNLQQDEYIDLAIEKVLKLEIISTTNNITEEQCKKYVEGFFKHDLSQNFDCWRNYYDPKGLMYSKSTAKKSLKSLMQANNLNIENNYLILKKL